MEVFLKGVVILKSSFLKILVFYLLVVVITLMLFLIAYGVHADKMSKICEATLIKRTNVLDIGIKGKHNNFLKPGTPPESTPSAKPHTVVNMNSTRKHPVRTTALKRVEVRKHFVESSDSEDDRITQPPSPKVKTNT